MRNVARMSTDVTGPEDEGLVSNYRLEEAVHHIDQGFVIVGVRWSNDPGQNPHFHQAHLLALYQRLYQESPCHCNTLDGFDWECASIGIPCKDHKKTPLVVAELP